MEDADIVMAPPPSPPRQTTARAKTPPPKTAPPKKTEGRPNVTAGPSAPAIPETGPPKKTTDHRPPEPSTLAQSTGTAPPAPPANSRSPQGEENAEESEGEVDDDSKSGNKRKRKNEGKTQAKKVKVVTKGGGDDTEVDQLAADQPPREVREAKRGRLAPTLRPEVFCVPCARCKKMNPPLRCRVKDSRSKKHRAGDVGACVHCNLAKVRCIGHSLGDIVKLAITEAETNAYLSAWASAQAEEGNVRNPEKTAPEPSKRKPKTPATVPSDVEDEPAETPRPEPTAAPKKKPEVVIVRQPKNREFNPSHILSITYIKKYPETAPTTRLPSQVASALKERIAAVASNTGTRKPPTALEGSDSDSSVEIVEYKQPAIVPPTEPQPTKSRIHPGPSFRREPQQSPSPDPPRPNRLPTPYIDYGAPGPADDEDREYLHSLPLPDLLAEVGRRLADRVEDTIQNYMSEIEEQNHRRWVSLDERLNYVENLIKSSHGYLKSKVLALRDNIDRLAPGVAPTSLPLATERRPQTHSASPQSLAPMSANVAPSASESFAPPQTRSAGTSAPPSGAASVDSGAPPSHSVAINVIPPTPHGSQQTEEGALTLDAEGDLEILEAKQTPVGTPNTEATPKSTAQAPHAEEPVDPEVADKKGGTGQQTDTDVIDDPRMDVEPTGPNADTPMPPVTPGFLQPPANNLLQPSSPARRSNRLRRPSQCPQPSPNVQHRSKSRSQSPMPTPTEEDQDMAM